jgi:hypothetical protein
MAKQINLNITSPLEMVFRKTVPIAASQTIRNGQWFELDGSGNAILSSVTTASTLPRFLAFNDSISPDVYGTLPDGTAVSTGGMTGLIGTIEGNVTSNGYDTGGGGFAAGSKLTVKSGKFYLATTSDAVYAYAKAAIGADGLLYFVGVSGYALYVV